jgi:transcriptional regulator GlxA family with amidase domain
MRLANGSKSRLGDGRHAVNGFHYSSKSRFPRSDVSSYPPSTHEKIAELPAWIIAHLDDDLSQTALAERAGVCRRHLQRLFKAAFDRTPTDFVEQLRLREAGHRLRATRISINRIASSVGYPKTDVFRRAFQRWVGLSPSEYRERFAFRQLIRTATG